MKIPLHMIASIVSFCKEKIATDIAEIATGVSEIATG
jgi:hypothetical protein